MQQCQNGSFRISRLLSHIINKMVGFKVYLNIKTTVMEVNENLREEMFQVVENQLNDEDLPEARATYDRLRKEEGFDDFQARQAIAQCVAVELYKVMTAKEPFDRDRYCKSLFALPKEPFD